MDHSHNRRWQNDAYLKMHNGDYQDNYSHAFGQFCKNKSKHKRKRLKSYSPNDYSIEKYAKVSDISHSKSTNYSDSYENSHSKRGKIRLSDINDSKKHTKLAQNSKKRKPYKFWDVAAKGFEHLTPQQYKAMQASGQIPINVYAAGQVPMPDDAPNAPIVLHSDLPFAGSAVCRQARRLYVGNIPIGLTEAAMADLFNTEMKSKNLVKDDDGDPVIAVQINLDKNFSFIELRSVEETTQALGLDGINYQGQQLKIRRPRDYVPLPGLSDEPPVLAIPGIISTNVQETPDKLYIGSLPNYLNEDQIKELLMSLGPLKSFNLVKDAYSGLSKGYAFCEYVDSKLTDVACQNLNGMELGEKHIVVQRASVGVKGHQQQNSSSGPTKILCLLNLIEESELIDDEEYEDIIDDVKCECEKYGNVVSMEIPRPQIYHDSYYNRRNKVNRSSTSNSNNNNIIGVGKVFVEFATIQDCQKAACALTGRKFNDRVVITSYFDLDKYHSRDFN